MFYKIECKMEYYHIVISYLKPYNYLQKITLALNNRKRVEMP